MTLFESLKNHLYQVGMMQAHVFKSNNPQGYSYFNYHSVEDYLLDRAALHESSKGLTDAELETVLQAASFSRLSFRPKECYHNAMMLAIHDRSGKISFCEGYAYTGAIPVAHAWNVINGKVVDLTRSLRPESAEEFCQGKDPQADLMDRVLGKFPEDWVYYGVTHSTDDVLNYVQNREQTGSLIDDYLGGYPLFVQERQGNSDPIDPNAWEALKEKARA